MPACRRHDGRGLRRPGNRPRWAIPPGFHHRRERYRDGVGGMMGAGLYTLVGLASTTAGVWVPLAFLVGGAVTVFSVYSYAKLGARYPSRGGAAHFLIRCFGDGVVAGGLNVFQFLGWIIAMALYVPASPDMSGRSCLGIPRTGRPRRSESRSSSPLLSSTSSARSSSADPNSSSSASSWPSSPTSWCSG